MLKKTYRSIKKHLSFYMIGIGILLGATSAVRAPKPLSGAYAGLAAPFDPHFSLVLSARAYDAAESRRFLSHDLLGKQIQPIELTIENHTPHEYSLCPSSVDLPQVEGTKVANQVFRSSIPRQAALRIAGFFFWPMAIPSTIDGIYTHLGHRKLRADYTAKSLKKEGETIPAYSTVHRVLFIPKEEMDKTLKLDLIDLENFFQSHVETPIQGPGSYNSEK